MLSNKQQFTCLDFDVPSVSPVESEEHKSVDFSPKFCLSQNEEEIRNAVQLERRQPVKR